MREPQKLDQMPDTGRFIIAHPDLETRAIELGREYFVDYLLSDLAPKTHTFMANMDEINALMTGVYGGSKHNI